MARQREIGADLNPAQYALAQAMLEEELLDSVEQLAKTLGCLFHHQRPAQTSAGRWRTTIRGHVGWPDVVIAGKRGTLVRELKSMRGPTPVEQRRWITRLIMGGTDAAVWKPVDWFSGRIEREIRAVA